MTTAVADIRASACGPTLPNESLELTHRELELGAIIDAYNQVTEKLKVSHEMLIREAGRLREQIKEKDRELDRRQRLAALGEMAAGVAHEVRNPLSGILLSATMLEDDLRALPQSRRLAEQISRAARALDGIVGDILAFASHAEPKRRAVVLNVLVREIVELLEPGAIEANCEVQVEDADRAVVIEADPAQIQRALLNVVSNAINAGGSGGHVWIRIALSERDDGTVEISVSDDGPGVPVALRDRIFNPFFTTRDSGTGLGLAIVHRIIESHGGRVGVGDRQGGGAAFSMTLPLTPRPPTTDMEQG